MKSEELYYKESGNISPISILAIIVSAIATAAVLGAVYGYATFLIPFIYLNVIITVFFGVAMGFVVNKVAYFTKSRNSGRVAMLGLLAGILAEYFGWVFWIHALTEQLVLSFNPLALFSIISSVAEEGAWSIFGGYTPTGFALYLIWAIEAGIIIIVSWLSTVGSTSSKPFCEDCGTWAEEKVLTSRLEPILNIEDFVEKIENKDFAVLTSLSNVKHIDPIKTAVKVLNCPSCDKAHYLKVDIIIEKVNDKGEKSEETKTIVENLIINKTAYDELVVWSKNIEEKEIA